MVLVVVIVMVTVYGRCDDHGHGDGHSDRHCDIGDDDVDEDEVDYDSDNYNNDDIFISGITCKFRKAPRKMVEDFITSWFMNKVWIYSLL